MATINFEIHTYEDNSKRVVLDNKDRRGFDQFYSRDGAYNSIESDLIRDIVDKIEQLDTILHAHESLKQYPVNDIAQLP